MTADRVVVELDGDEALVLFDWISRINRRGAAEFEDQAEQRVLWDIECSLEKSLVEPFGEDYPALLAAARDRVRDVVE
ncbi:hypothetical protein BLA60_18275 [Actinophytocola xinjiangensis]|uniref:Uncharacterized protein n=1 Tax=Actinophytocola xinjiangensis TaxID=485602 RepID=A0A7Z1AXW9_9PSEU|nr:hypothetical protein [Actinophytocola xinjiangensis]OLF09729.1 hypothetical protein BLA60_18275 [Actinophytocola xinjiangensis]